MFASLSIVQIPIIILVPIAFLSVALPFYILTRFRQKKVSPEWQEAQQYGELKGLSPEQWLVVRAMLKRYAASEPFEALSYRHEFDRCVREQISAISGVAQRDRMGETLYEIRTLLDLVKVPEGGHWTSTLDLAAKQTVKARPLQQENCPLSEFYIKHVNDAYFFLSPRNPELAADASEGSQYLIQACHPGDARYEFVGEVAAIRANPVRLMIGHVFEMKRMQARAHERSAYTVSTPMDIFTVPEDRAHDPLKWLHENKPENQATAAFMNLSAGGYAAILHITPPPNRAYARVTISLGREDFPPFTVFSQIVDTVALAEDRTLVRASFAGISPQQEEAIERYVAEALQRDQEGQRA